jgi:hypothetical protein
MAGADQRSASPAFTPSMNAFHSACVNVSTGDSSPSLLSRNATPPSGRGAHWQQSPLPFDLLDLRQARLGAVCNVFTFLFSQDTPEDRRRCSLSEGDGGQMSPQVGVFIHLITVKVQRT